MSEKYKFAKCKLTKYQDMKLKCEKTHKSNRNNIERYPVYTTGNMDSQYKSCKHSKKSKKECLGADGQDLVGNAPSPTEAFVQ